METQHCSTSDEHDLGYVINMAGVNAHTLARRGGDTEKRQRIFDAAEKLFAENGFAGTPLRAISSTAGVDLALINHHFGSKQRLFEAVISRRADIVHRDRLEALEDCRTRAKGAPTIDGLVNAFLSPLFGRATNNKEWRSYLRLVAKLSVEREWVETLSRLYNPTAKYFINAMRMSYPDASEEQLFWAYHFLLGSMVFTGADSGRIDDISGGVVRSDDFAASFRHLVTFVSAGVHAILVGS
jgi:AcrR family transcriptional regulator